MNLRKSKNAFLTLTLLLMLATGLQASLSDGLVAYYPFNGNANDESGNGNHGTEHGGPSYVSGVCGEAISLDGMDDYVIVEENKAPPMRPAGTISGWLKIPSTFPFPRWGAGFVNKMLHSTGLYLYDFAIGHDGPCFAGIGDGSGAPDSGKYVYWSHSIKERRAVQDYLFDDTWHHLAYTWDSEELILYVDGAFQNSTTHSVNVYANDPMQWDLNIGRRPYASPTNWKYLEACIDEVRIYDRALSQTEVMELAGVGPSEPIAYWSFDNPSDPGHDDSGNGNDGTVYGAESTNGIYGGAMSFDGVDDYIDLGMGTPPDDLRITGALTASAWIQPEPAALIDNPTIVARHGWDVKRQWSWGLRLMVGAPEGWVSESGNSIRAATGEDVVDTDAWHHLAMTYVPGASVRIYLDGAIVGEAVTSVPGSLNDPEGISTYIGASWAFTGVPPCYFFTGYIDEVRIYDWALSQTEVMELAAIPESPSGGKLLVRSHNGSDWDLHLIGEDGSHLQAIDTTSANIEFRGASFSPDGKNILYLRSSGATYEIMQVPVSGGSPSLLLNSTGLPYALLAARWGSPPDHFFYTIQTGGSCGNRDWVTRRRALDGSFDEIIISAISEKDLYLYDIREDLNRSVYGQNIPAGCWSPYGALVTYDADGSNRHVLPPTNDVKADSHATLSQDGEYILYAKSDSASGWQNPANIYIIRYDGSDQTRLTNYLGNIAAHAPVWRDDDSFFYTLGEHSDGELHYYTISTGEDVVLPCDLPNCQPLDFIITPEAPTIPATIEIIPNTLNLKSKGRWITCYIWLPEGYDVSDISNILLEDNIEPRQMWSDEKKQVMKTRFSRKEVQAILEVGDIELTITGQLSDGTLFEGTDIIRVIDEGRRKN